MRAYVLEDFGQSPRLTELPRPVAGPDEVLLRVVSSSVNPVDVLVARGYFRQIAPYRFPVVLGRDVHGVVVDVGDQVNGYQVGDPVFGFLKRDYTGDGAFAEYVACRPDRFVTHVPDGVSAEQAGVLGVSGVTAQASLDAVRLTAGDTLLVLGGAGGTGTFTVQLAAAIGARVVATGRAGEQSRLLSQLGADVVLDWTAGDIAGQVRRTVPGGVDAIVDLARPRGGDAAEGEQDRRRAFADFVRVVAGADARVVSTTNAVDPQLLGDVEAHNVHSNPVPSELERLAERVVAGQVRPVITETYDLDQVESALARLDKSVTGKISLRVDVGGSL
jgi:NADPH:quinone reductase-like Zn-dependent oxidoreductase